MKNSESNFTRLIREIALEEGMELKAYSDNWAFRLSKDGRETLVLGYDFELNTAPQKAACTDKALCYELLKERNVPAVPHWFLPDARLRAYVNAEDPSEAVRGALDRYGSVVLKDNYGTGGNHVFRVENTEEFEAARDDIFAHSSAMALCPFYEIREEYRVVMLDGTPRLFIRKERAYDLNEAGEKVYRTWKHNLGLGASGAVVDDEALKDRLGRIAKAAVAAVGVRFASADIIDTSEGFLVLELNGGVMMEHFSGQSAACFETAKAIYREALHLCLGKEEGDGK